MDFKINYEIKGSPQFGIYNQDYYFQNYNDIIVLKNYSSNEKGGLPCPHEEIKNILFASVVCVYDFHQWAKKAH